MKTIKILYQTSRIFQIVYSILQSIIGLIISILIISIIKFPLVIFFIVIIKPIIHFAITPLLKLTGYFNYFSSMLLGVKKNSLIELHTGTLFDYFLNLHWKEKGIKTKKKLMLNYLAGLLILINEIECDNIPKQTDIVGISFIFSEKTASKMGFSLEPVPLHRQILFYIDYFDLFFMTSFAKGKISFPNITKVKKIKITGENLVKSKKSIQSLLSNLEKRFFENSLEKVEHLNDEIRFPKSA